MPLGISAISVLATCPTFTGARTREIPAADFAVSRVLTDPRRQQHHQQFQAIPASVHSKGLTGK